jgi:hypothetical protein
MSEVSGRKTPAIFRMRFWTLALPVLCLWGCASPPPPSVRVESDPPGARVFFGQGANEDFASPKDYIGTTPFTWLPPHNGNGEFQITGAMVYSTFVPSAVIVEARPPAGSTNFFAQRVVYHGGTIAHGADKIPAGIFFDLARPTSVH